MDPSIALGGDQGTPQVLYNQDSASARAYREATQQLVRRVAIMTAEKSGQARSIDSFELVWQTLAAPETPPSPRQPPKKEQGVSRDTPGVDLRIVHLAQTGERTLEIAWTDGQVTRLDVVTWRAHCPCASCVDEWSGEKRVKKENIPESVRPLKIKSVGSYAVQVWFNDGHSTGIYTYHLLRTLGGQGR
jgi:DUF971 family protein